MSKPTQDNAAQEIYFWGSDFSLKVQNPILSFNAQEDESSKCCLTFQLEPQLYKQIAIKSCFNLRRELQNALSVSVFHDEGDIEIEAALKPQLVPQILEHTNDSNHVIAYLTNLSQQYLAELESNTAEQPPTPPPLLLTESWFALSVKQHLESGEIGYRTFWSYVNPATLTPEAIASGQFAEAMEQFLKDRNEADISMVGKAISEVFEEMANSFKGWDETDFLKETETAISDIFAEVTKAFENWPAPAPTASDSHSSSTGKIYQAVINFFSEDDWAFAKLQGEPTLKLAFKGKNGQWNCYAKEIEERQQFIFYSICPLTVPESKRLAIAELLARINYSSVIGNFEFNFTQGEIFYKTSIDITGTHINSALIKNLVYTNVMMMDTYLPGIQAVLSGTASPEAAIQQVES